MPYLVYNENVFKVGENKKLEFEFVNILNKKFSNIKLNKATIQSKGDKSDTDVTKKIKSSDSQYTFDLKDTKKGEYELILEITSEEKTIIYKREFRVLGNIKVNKAGLKISKDLEASFSSVD